jgi:tetratricopeptide (TPR) repeat protein
VPMLRCKPLFMVPLMFAMAACTTVGAGDNADTGSDSVKDAGLTSEPAPQSTPQSTPQPTPQLTGDLLYQLLVGEFAGNTGDLDISVDAYQRAAELSHDGRIAARAAYIAMYGQKYEQALEALVRWEQLAPESDEVNRMYAVVYLKLHQPRNAVIYVRKIINESDISSREKTLFVKKLLSKESNIEDSLVVLAELNRKEPGNLHMLILQARFSAQLEQFDEAIKLLEKVLAEDSSLSDVHIIKARILAAQGKRQESEDLMMMVLGRHPDNSNLRMQYARMLVEDRKFDPARKQFLILRKQTPESPEVLMSLALLYIETKQLNEASEYLDQLIKMGKNIDVANYYHGRIAQNREDHKLAISYYQKVKNGTYVFEAQLRIAGLFARLGKADEAVEQLEVLAEKQTSWPNRVRAYLAQGEIMRSAQRFTEAFELYSRALMQNPEDPDLLYARALTAEKVDRLDITEADLLKVLSTEPENANALNALGYTLADRTGRLQEALEYIKRAMELVPDDPAILDSLGWVSFRLGKLQDAEKWLAKAFEILEDAEIAAHYGEVLWKLEQRDKAREVWKKGRENNAKHSVLIETVKRLDK